MNVQRGMRFLHSRIINEQRQPAEYVVTAVRRGTVYYKQPDEGKAHQCADLKYFTDHVVKEVLK